jgi:hypothetical protein
MDFLKYNMNLKSVNIKFKTKLLMEIINKFSIKKLNYILLLKYG